MGIVPTVPSGIYTFAQACADVPGTIPQIKDGALTCVPRSQAAYQGGTLGLMNVFSGADKNWLVWGGVALLAVLVLTGSKSGRRR